LTYLQKLQEKLRSAGVPESQWERATDQIEFTDADWAAEFGADPLMITQMFEKLLEDIANELKEVAC
jgi:hypothetical protein